MEKQQIKKIRERIQELKKINKEQRGRKSRLFDSDFCEKLIDGIKKFTDNGFQVYKYLIEQNVDISYKQTQEYIKKIFGSYSKKGRPAKYLGDERKII